MKQLLNLVLTVLMLFSLTAAAFAAEITDGSDVVAKYITTYEGEYRADVVGGKATAGGVSVTGAPENAVTLAVVPMEGEALSWVSGCVDGNAVAAYDIHFLDAEGNRVNANGATVSITASGTDLTVSSVTTNGANKTLTSEVSGGKVSFTTDGSHYYVILAHAHSFTNKASDVKATNATCTEAATYYVRCDNCSEHTTEKTVPVGNPLGHDWDGGTVTVKPTCEKDGVRTFTCKRDNTHTYTKAEPATGHSFTKYESNNDATCKKNGTETAKCDHGCGKTDTRTDRGSKLGHKYEDGKCIRCGLSWWNPETGDKIMIAVTVMALSGAALLILFLWRKKKQKK